MKSDIPMFMIRNNDNYLPNNSMNELLRTEYSAKIINRIIPKYQPDGMLSIEKEINTNRVVDMQGNATLYWQYTLPDKSPLDTTIRLYKKHNLKIGIVTPFDNETPSHVFKIALKRTGGSVLTWLTALMYYGYTSEMMQPFCGLLSS